MIITFLTRAFVEFLKSVPYLEIIKPAVRLIVRQYWIRIYLNTKLCTVLQLILRAITGT